MLKFISFMMIAVLCLKAEASDLIQTRAYFLETTKTELSVEVAKQQKYTPYQGVLTQGYGAHIVWIKLIIDPTSRNADIQDRLVLRIQPGMLDEITLYDSLDNLPKRVGDRFSQENTPYRSLNHNFLIPSGNAPRTLWLRLKTNSSKVMQIEALPLREAQMADLIQQIFLGAVQGLIAVLCLLALTIWIESKNAVARDFLLLEIIFFFYTASGFGFFRVLLPDSFPATYQDTGYSIIAMLYLHTSILFYHNFLKSYNISSRGLRIFRWGAWMLPIQLLCFTAGMISTAMAISQIGALVAMVMLIGLIASPQSQPSREGNETIQFPRSGLLLILAGTFASTLLLWVLPLLGWYGVGTEFVSIYGGMGQGLFAGLLVAYDLLRRIKSERQTAANIKATNKANEVALITEQRLRTETHEFMSMLTHELKTPMAVIRMTIGNPDVPSKIRATINRAITSMQDVVTRCTQVESITGHPSSVQISNFDVSGLVNEVVKNSIAPHRIHVHSGTPHFYLKTDRQLIDVILDNLVDNALKHSHKDSSVEIKMEFQNRLNASGLSIYVSNPIGPSGAPDSTRIFNKYYRSDKARRVTGAGLGLHLSKALAHRLGATLDYFSDNQIITFELWIPTTL